MDKKDNTHKIVVAALIERNGKYLIAKRKDDAVLGGLWEFPGGKVEDGETEQEALEREIVEEFNTLIAVGKLLVSGQGGMRKSNRANNLILFALHNTGNPYEDKWDDQGVLHYTGMGLSGDQSIDYAQNKTLAESRTNGVGVHLFESFEPKEYICRGQVQLVGDPYYERQKDEANNQRQVVKFPLRLSQQ